MPIPRSAIPVLVLSLATLAACAKGGDKATDSAAAALASPPPAAVPAPHTLMLADLAGTWSVVSTPIDGNDKSPTSMTLTADADGSGWMETFAGRKPVPVRVRVDGDSLISETALYDSFRRKGVKVSTNGVWRLHDGKLVGATVAHYSVKGADSVLHLSVVGTRIP